MVIFGTPGAPREEVKLVYPSALGRFFEEAKMGGSSMAIRVALALLFGVGAWTVLRLVTPADYEPWAHIARGALLSLAVLSFLWALMRFDRLRSGLAPAKAVGEFLHGMALWLLPALVSLAACMLLGWTDIRLLTDVPTVLWRLALLFVGVLLIEALPEELLFRGYIQGLLGRRFARWIALVGQAGVFVLFGWLVGAIGSVEQLMFLPGLALILGYVRAASGSTAMAVGFHTAWMTGTQLLGAHQGQFAVAGMGTLQFAAFLLLPAAAAGVWLDRRSGGLDWKGCESPGNEQAAVLRRPTHDVRA